MNSGYVPEEYLVRLLPILSNLTFALAAARALWRGYGFKAFLFMLIAVFTSPSYHVCKSFPSACIWTAAQLHVIDFWSATLVIPVLSIHFVRFRVPFVEKFLILTSLVAVGLLVVSVESSLASQAIVAAVSLGLVVLYAIWYRWAHGHWPRYDLIQLTLGTGFIVLGVSFFVAQDWYPPYYGYLHSYWHASVGIGAYFIMGIREAVDPALNMETRIVAERADAATVIPSYAMVPGSQSLVRRADRNREP